MDGEELGGTFVISVDELGLNGLWSTIKDLVEAGMPLQGITLPNKVGKPVAVPRLPLMFVLSTDKRLLRLKQYSHSPVTWFRNPHTHLVLVSTADVHEYKSTTRAQLKRVTADIEKDWGGAAVGSEWLMLYVRPFELDPADKGARKVFEKLCDDFASKRRERVVRLDIPLQAFTGPAATAGSRTGSRAATGGGAAPNTPALHQSSGAAVWGAGATGLDELSAGLRDSIRAAFEARQAAYDTEVRRLLNERRDPKWSFTTLYLVKDSFALMLEGAGLWEDAFQEYVELETVYLDTLETQSAAAAASSGTAAEAAAAAVRESADFGLTGSDSEDVASLLSSSWRTMRRLVLWKKSVQEFHFRQYLFAAQARVLLRLGRPIDVAERGLVFVQNFLAILASREAQGLVKPWFKECWAFSACMSLITAITTYTAQTQSSQDWDVELLLSSGAAPSAPAGHAAMRQLATVVAAEKAAAVASGTDARSNRRSAEHDRGRSSIRVAATSPTAALPSASTATAVAAAPVLAATDWELDATSSSPVKVVGGGGSSGSGMSSVGASATLHKAGSGGVVDAFDEYEDVPPLDLGVLCGQSITPASASLLFQPGEQRRELMDKLYCCLLGHLYHLARGELLRLGSALRLPEAAAAAKGGASILQLCKTAFAPAPAATATSGAAASARSSTNLNPARSTDTGSTGSTTASKGGTVVAAKAKAANSLTAGVDLLTEAAAAGTLSPRMVAQLQELMLMPLCGFSQIINKYADGSGAGLTYEVHTPKLNEDPLAAALSRSDSQSTPNHLNHISSFANSFVTTPTSSSSSSAAGAAAAAAAAGSGMLDRLRRGSSAASSSSGSSSAAGGATVSQHSSQAGMSGLSRLSRVATEAAGAPPTAVSDSDSAAAAAANFVVSVGSVVDLQRQDSCTSLATVHIGEETAASGAQHLEVSSHAASSFSSATVAGEVASLADNAVSSALLPDRPQTGQQAVVTTAPSAAASVPTGASGVGIKESTLGLGPGPPKVATHARSASALPTAGGGSGGVLSGRGGLSGAGVQVSPRRLEGLVDPGAMAAAGPAGQATSTAGRTAPAQLSLVHPAAAASAAASVPSWVGEWRLQLALRNAACFEELLLALSKRAAWCYAKAGRLRSSALIYADVAVLALQRGQLEQAARLLNRMQQIFAAEGWQQLLGAVLPKLLAVQRLAAQPLLPFTAVALLALPPGAAAAADRQAAFEELLSAVGAVSASALGLGVPLLNPSPARCPNPSSAGEQQLLQLAMLSAVQLRPAPGTYSHFFGHEVMQAVEEADAVGGQQEPVPVPRLSPPARVYSTTSSGAGNTATRTAFTDGTGKKGAALLAVGDSLSLTVDVVSRLPGPVVLRHLVLSLVQLHKATWLSSIGGNSIFSYPSGSIVGSTSGPPCFGSTGMQQQQQHLGVGNSLLSKTSLSSALFNSSNDSPRVAVQRWQEGDELLGTKLLAAYTPGSSGDPYSITAVPDSKGSSTAYHCQLLPDGSVVLAPGVNRLVFRLSPVREGLYCLKQLRALIGSTGELLIRMPPPESLSLLAAAAAAPDACTQQQQGQLDVASASVLPADLYPVPLPGHSGTGGTAEAVQIGGVTGSGSIVSEVVVARVVGPSPRLRLSPVVPGGCLPVGCTAWLGVLLSPLHDAVLQRPRLHVQPNQLVSLTAAVAPGKLVGQGLGIAQQGVGVGGLVSGDSFEQQQQQLVTSGLGGSSASSISAPPGLQLQQQIGHWVYVMPLQQQNGTRQAAAAPGHWLPVTRGGVDLSEVVEGNLAAPLLVWMQVLVGSPIVAPATVTVATQAGPTAIASITPPPPAAAAAAVASNLSRLSCVSSSSSALPAAAGARAAGSSGGGAVSGSSAAAVSKVIPDQCVLLPSRPLDAAAELALQLEYTAGVWRSHSCCLQLPLQQPAAISASALQLPHGIVALNITISLEPDAASSMLLLEAGLRPQYGLVLGSSRGLAAPSLGEVLPVRVLPGGSAGLCFILTHDQGDKLTGSFEVDGSSLLLLSYVLESVDCNSEVTDPSTGQQLPVPPVSTAEAAAVGPADAAAGAASAEAAQDALAASSSFSSSNLMSLRLPFWLEFPCSAPAATATLRATLLGPFTGRIGQPLILSWQLTRTGPTGTTSAWGDEAGSTVGFSTIDLNSSSAQVVTVDGERDASDYSIAAATSQQIGSDREYDEVLCYEVAPGQQLGTTSQNDLLRTSFQGPAAVAAAVQSGTSNNSDQGSAWWSGGSITGMVRLGRAAGSLAAVEVVLNPRVVGRHLPPQLLLRSLGGNQPLLVEGGVAGGLWMSDDQCINISS